MPIQNKAFIIREEIPVDIPAIRNVNEHAFGQPQEAGIVDALRKNCERLLSLVAEDDVFMALVFAAKEFENIRGVVRYRHEFDGAI